MIELALWVLIVVAPGDEKLPAFRNFYTEQGCKTAGTFIRAQSRKELKTKCVFDAETVAP